MPVVGLPTALEVSLDALLQQHHLTSWKITGDDDSTVVVIRLKADTAHSNMASQQQPVCRQHYRKKAPSQLNRDKRRAEDRRTKTTQNMQDVAQASDSHNNDLPSLFMFTPPTSHSIVHTDTDLPPNTPDPDSAREIRRSSTDSTAMSTGACSEQQTTITVLPSLKTLDDSDDCLQKVQDAGWSASLVKDYVSQLTDRSLQRNLRDTNRNTDFCRVFTSDESPDTIVCESDDVIFEFSWTCDNDDDDPTHFSWLAKRDSSQMGQEERAIHGRLQRWAPADRERVKERIEAGRRVFQIILPAIRIFLG